MTQAHFDGFVRDLTTINGGINLTGGCGRISSIAGLVNYLEDRVAHPTMLSVQDCRNQCANPNDTRLTKYVPAMQRLTQVWGRGAHRTYPRADQYIHANEAQRMTAYTNFFPLLGTLQLADQFAYTEICQHDGSVFDFNRSLGHGYLHRVVQPTGAFLDITARSLLLKAGLAVPEPIGRDNGYIEKLQLDGTDFTNMRDASILDVGCGAAFFCAEMQTLYNATAHGVDLNAVHVGAALNNGVQRYVRSMLYLKMMLDLGRLGMTSVDPGNAALLAQILANLPTIVNNYRAFAPITGDVFNLGAALARTYDYTICMYMLCYFDAPHQTQAVENMCGVTNHEVLLFSGLGAVISPDLIFDQDRIRGLGWNIRVLDRSTHRLTRAV